MTAEATITISKSKLREVLTKLEEAILTLRGEKE